MAFEVTLLAMMIRSSNSNIYSKGDSDAEAISRIAYASQKTRCGRHRHCENGLREET